MATAVDRLMTTAAGRPAAPFTRETAPALVTVHEAALTLGCPTSTVLEAITRRQLATAPSLTPRVVLIPRESLWPTESAEPLTLGDAVGPTPPASV